MPQRPLSNTLDLDLMSLCFGGMGADYGGGGGGFGGFDGGFGGFGGGDFGGGIGDFGGGIGDFGGGFGDFGSFDGGTTDNGFGPVDFGTDTSGSQDGWGQADAISALQTQGDAILNQGQIGDCPAVAVIREIGSTPEGQAYLNTMVQDKGDGFYQVTLVGADGQAQQQTVWLHPGEIFGIGDANAMAIEKALVYNAQAGAGIEGMNGMRTDIVMEQLGLTNISYGAPNTALNVGVQGQIFIASTDSPAVGPMPNDLVANHAYGVPGTITDANGNVSVVLSNPWGDIPGSQPPAIPADQLAGGVVGVTTGTVSWPDP